MNETIISKPLAETIDLTKQDIPADTFGKIRIYRYSPSAILFSIRTKGPTNYNHSGAEKLMLTSTILTADEAKQIVSGLTTYIEEIETR